MKIGLVQINSSFSGQAYFPYSVGLLQAYVQFHMKDADHLEFLLPVFRRTPVKETVQSLRPADLVFFSTYVWNIRISLEIARCLKKDKPDMRIVFGGPQVPDHAREFLTDHPWVDVVVHGEGEATALELVRCNGKRSCRLVEGISFFDDRGVFRYNGKRCRIEDLTNLPSPYLADTFAPLMDAFPSQRWIALWETNRGCPFSCTFCDWGSSVHSRVYRFSMARLRREVEWMSKHRIEFIFCCDANFGLLSRDEQIVQHVVELKKKHGYPCALSVQNTKNSTQRTFEIQRVLSEGGLNKGVTLSVQSLDPTTLLNVRRRNISLSTYHDLQVMFTRAGIETYTDIIIGLPGETYDTMVDGINVLIANGQHNRIQFNNLSILPNSTMGDLAYQQNHQMWVVTTDLINVHGAPEKTTTGIMEKQQLVVGTKDMPPQDWVRARAFCWMTALVYFDKLLQIPLLAVHHIYHIPFREMLERFTLADNARFPVIAAIQQFFIEKGQRIQNGETEYCHLPEHLNIFWPADEFMLIKLIKENQIDTFYHEAHKMLIEIVGNETADAGEIVREAVLLNQNMLKRPSQYSDIELPLSYNIWDFYQGCLRGENTKLQQGRFDYLVDRTATIWESWEDFCREVIWYGNKKGAYLYPNVVLGE